MDVHAGLEELPELREFLDSLALRFRRPESRQAPERYTTGRLTELPNKNGDTMAQAVPATSEQRLQEFLTNMQWDEEDLNQQRVQKMVAEAPCGWSWASAEPSGCGVGRARPFPPRPDRRRETLTAVHREVASWLRHQGVLW